MYFFFFCVHELIKPTGTFIASNSLIVTHPRAAGNNSLHFLFWIDRQRFVKVKVLSNIFNFNDAKQPKKLHIITFGVGKYFTD